MEITQIEASSNAPCNGNSRKKTSDCGIIFSSTKIGNSRAFFYFYTELSDLIKSQSWEINHAKILSRIAEKMLLEAKNLFSNELIQKYLNN